LDALAYLTTNDLNMSQVVGMPNKLSSSNPSTQSKGTTLGPRYSKQSWPSIVFWT
jgi:hypothetical protein